MATDTWPTVELHRCRLQVRFRGTDRLDDRQRRAWADLEEWVVWLGGSVLAGPPGTVIGS